MKDNTRTAVGYVCITLVIVSYILFLGWILTPSEFTFKIEMDNNTKEAVESIQWDNDFSNKRHISNHSLYYGDTWGDKDYRLDGTFNFSDSDKFGDCWSFEGVGERTDWRMLLSDGSEQIRRCVKRDNSEVKK